MTKPFPSIRILAVLVLFKRRSDQAASWPVLRELVNSPKGPLHGCLVYDNSPDEAGEAPSLPQGFTLLKNPNNGGTARAYEAAVATSRALNCDWLLLLDQDTVLPKNYLDRLTDVAQARPLTDAVVPRVWHGVELISPAVVTRIGSIRPSSRPSERHGTLTAISSGALIRTDVLAAIVPLPEHFWLDYVDHWIFLRLSQMKRKVEVADVDLVHDLSIKSPGSLSELRLKSVLSAEKKWYANLSPLARALLPLRVLLRGIRYALTGNAKLALLTFSRAFRG